MTLEEAIKNASVCRKKLAKKAFKMAKEQSEESDYKKEKLGAVITHKSKILAWGANSKKDHTLQNKYNIYRDFSDDTGSTGAAIHAEMAAIINLKKLYSYEEIRNMDLAIWIFREHKCGDIATAAPCPACQAALNNLNIRDIYFTDEKSISKKQNNTSNKRK